MGNIREYTQQTTTQAGIPGRRAQAGDFGNVGLSALGTAASKAAKVLENRATQLEVTDAYTQLAKAQAEWTLHLQERGQEAEPGDEGFADKYNEDLKTFLDEARDRYKTRIGQQTWDRGAATLSANMLVQSGQFQAKLAGVKGAQDYATLVDSGQIIVNNDPSQFNAVMKSTIDALKDKDSTYINIPVLNRPATIRITQEQLAASAMKGIIREDPELGKKMLLKGLGPTQFLKGEEKESLQKEAEVGIRGLKTEENRVRAEMIAARKEKERVIQDEFIQQLDKDELTSPMVMASDLAPVGTGSKEHFRRLIAAKTKEQTEPIRKEPSVFLGVLDEIRSGSITNESQIEEVYALSAESGHGIDWPDAVTLRKELADLRTPQGARLGKRRGDFMTGVSPQIDKSNPMMGKIDASGRQQVYEFSFFVDEKVEQYKQDPTKDPFDLFDPSKPDYLGKSEVLAGFQKTFQESMSDFSKSLSGRGRNPANINARKPGESIDKYNKRTESK